MLQRYPQPSPYVGFNFAPDAWARHTFGAVQLGDQRRTQRVVDLATALVRQPSASLPTQTGSWAALKAAYRLLDQEDVTHATLLAPHLRYTRGRAGAHPLVLLLQDTTTLDYSHHPTTSGLGPIGDGRGQGYLLQTVLAVVPHTRQVLGIAHQEPFLRQPAPPKETKTQRARRPRESLVWERAASAIGTPPPGATWVHVGDSGSDIWTFLTTCRAQDAEVLIRVAQDRRVIQPDGTLTPLLATLRALPAQDRRPLALPAQHGQPARTAQLAVSWTALTLRAPHPKREAGLALWGVRVWEPAPPEGVAALEWLLLTSVPVATTADAWERADWYALRWLDEDYHQCLKTGCRIEQRQMQTYARLERLLGLLAPVAVYLLQLRELTRQEPERRAAEVLPETVVQVVAVLADVPGDRLTVGQCWRVVAHQGGYLGRTGDGPPGWQTLWRGWQYMQTLIEGIQLATRLPRDQCG